MVGTKEGEMVKLIHCADVHLHSRLNTHLSVQQSKERNGELVSSFVNMVEYGHRHGVSAVLIAGDLFDSASVPYPGEARKKSSSVRSFEKSEVYKCCADGLQ